MFDILIVFACVFLALLFINAIFVVVFTINNMQTRLLMKQTQKMVHLTQQMQAELEAMARKTSDEVTNSPKDK